jgi:hypothetical protein
MMDFKFEIADSDVDSVEDIDSIGSEKASLLTKTLVSSPIVKDIFEANLRTYSSQDIIFVKVPPPTSMNSADHRIT